MAAGEMASPSQEMSRQPSLDSANTTVCGLEDEKVEPIAIIGFSGRLPQDASSADGFWRLLCEGRSARTEIPKSRFNIDAFYHPDPDRIDSSNIRTGHFVDGDIGAFDAPFFQIQPAEVVSMDPQQRLILEASYRALENAGQPMESVVGSKTSVFVGASARDYETILLRDPENPAKYLGTGIGTSLLANRVSWFFDLRGTSIALDTACSSSLSALHLACQSLRSHETRMGLVGGVNLILAPELSMIHLSNMGFFSPDGKCFSFDHRANGYAKGEGAGVVVVKRLVDALEDGDTIRAVIRNTGANQDGRTPGITQPSKAAQEQNIRDTYEGAGLDLDTTKYFEAHGTGTQIGDPIEAGAIHNAFQRQKDDPLYIGAVKTNIGHLEAASGVAGLMKTVMILENGIIPPNLWFERPNESIPADEWRLKFPTEVTPWPAPGVRRASVNSFGYGGANCHAIVEDAFHYLNARGLKGRHCTAATPRLPLCSEAENKDSVHQKFLENETAPAVSKPTSKIFVWSASDEEGLKRLGADYEAYLSKSTNTTEGQNEDFLDDLAFSLSNKRSSLPWKSFAIANTTFDLKKAIASGLSKPFRSSVPPTISFVFTGQGAQWARMGLELLEHPIFKSSLDRSGLFLENLGCEWNMLDELSKVSKESDINSPAKAQPLCTALQIGLVDLFTHCGILPAAVVGHSSGEIAAAYCVGSLSHESAIKVAYFRGLLAARLAKSEQSRGSMLSVSLSEAEIAPYLLEAETHVGHGKLSSGCVNSPKSVTLTGDMDCINKLNSIMESKGVFARKLPINVAYHSSYMEEVAMEYASLIADIGPGPVPLTKPWLNAHRTIFSSVTGSIIHADELSQVSYWITNLVSQVKFSSALGQLCTYLMQLRETTKTSKDILVEVGPHGGLQRPVKDTIDGISDVQDITYDYILKRDESDIQQCLSLVGRLHCQGCKIDLPRINSPFKKGQDLKMLVDLPQYPFNHSTSYWYESRISRNFRMRKHVRHELFGSPSMDWNPMEPKWRNILRFADNPWLPDHKLSGSVLFPAAGMMTAVIEALRQHCQTEDRISGYHLTDISFHRSLPLSSSPDGVDTHLHFHPYNVSTKEICRANDFVMYAFLNEEWLSICKGTVNLEIDEHSGTTAINPKIEHALKYFQQGAKECKNSVKSSTFYKNLSSCGFEFGPTFQLLSQISYSDAGKAVATVKLDGWRDKVDAGFVQDHVVHPTALDGILQLTMAAISKGTEAPIPTMVPTNLKSIWVSPGLLSRGEDDELRIFTDMTFKGYREADFSIVAVDPGNNVRVLIEGWREVALNNSLEPFVLDSAEDLSLCYRIDWKPDLALMTPFSVKTYCESAGNSEVLIAEEKTDRWELFSLLFMSETLKAAKIEPFQGLPSHLQKYMDWMEHHFDEKKFNKLLATQKDRESLIHDADFREKLLDDFASHSPESLLCVEVGRNLTKMLKGEIDPLDFLFSGNLAQGFYHSPAFQRSYAKLSAFVDLMAHKNAGLQILEIGAGTGAATVPILRRLSGENGPGKPYRAPRFGQYTYTDISPAFLEGAKETFMAYSDRMKYTVLDIEKDPLEQGFSNAQYDLIICGLVLHATTDIHQTLQNTRRLLKPGGKLIFLEPSNPTSVRVSFVFGLLPGWWLSTEEKRKWGPLLSDKDWNESLLDSGFSGAEICLPDHYDEERHTFSALISSAVEEQPEANKEDRKETFIIASEDSPDQQRLALDIKQSLKTLDVHDTEICSMKHIEGKNIKGGRCIVLLELDRPFLQDMTSDTFSALKIVVSSAEGILWLTQGCGEKSEDPRRALATGFGRTVRSESIFTRFVELSLEKESTQTLSHISHVYKTSLLSSDEAWESEFMEKDGQLFISRAVEARDLNETIDSKLIQKPPKPEILSTVTGDDRTLELAVATPGMLESLYFRDDLAVDKELATDEVEIKVQATEISIEDAAVALGQISGHHFGSQCSGTVVRFGSSVENLQIGDRVCCCTSTGSFKTKARASASAVARISDDLSWEETAAFSAPFSTAYYAIYYVARLREGENVLVQSPTSTFGQSAIQLAKLCKAKVFTIVETVEEASLIHRAFDIPMEHISIGNGSEILQEPLKTSDGGFDVVLKSRLDDHASIFWSCLKPLGRYIEIRGRGACSPREVPATAQAQGISFVSVDLGTIMTSAKPLMSTILKSAMELLNAKKVKFNPLQPLRCFDVSDIRQGFEAPNAKDQTGQVVITMRDDATIPIAPSLKPTYSFSSNATYVLVGGFGGLGRTLLGWMADRGARNFLVLSRSGAKSAAAQDIISELQRRGVNVEGPCCDVTLEDSVLSAVENCQRTMPPIKGCIQASMVLKDGLFENSSLDDFNSAIRPKAQGSWNLHTTLPKDLDFFVLLSSISGVTGSRGQTNYAAGNTYQDALARHRVSIGQKCISVDLGSILDVGFAAEQDLTEALERDGFRGVKKTELVGLLEYCCNPNLPLPSTPYESQIVTGLSGINRLDAEGLSKVYWAGKPLFSVLTAASSGNHGSDDSNSAQSTNKIDYANALRTSVNLTSAHIILLDALQQKLANGLNISVEDIDPDKAIYTYGIDSLVALEVRYWFSREMGVEIGVIDIMQSPSLRELARTGVERSKFFLEGEEGRKGDQK